MSTRRSTKVKRCPTCRINLTFCFCAALKPQQIQHQISVVIHVRELKLTSNTAYFLEKMLPDQTKLWVRGRVHENFEAQTVLNSSKLKPLYVYPDESAEVFDEKFMEKNPGPYHFIIPDGSWTQARKVHKREELLGNLPLIKLPENLQGQYLLRKARFAHWLSTFEAMAYVLKAAGEVHVAQEMLDFFKVFNERVHLTRNLFAEENHEKFESIRKGQ
jgi:DTW domain-containing protein